jgi:hypothetical protein
MIQYETLIPSCIFGALAGHYGARYFMLKKDWKELGRKLQVSEDRNANLRGTVTRLEREKFEIGKEIENITLDLKRSMEHEDELERKLSAFKPGPRGKGGRFIPKAKPANDLMQKVNAPPVGPARGKGHTASKIKGSK